MFSSGLQAAGCIVDDLRSPFLLIDTPQTHNIYLLFIIYLFPLISRSEYMLFVLLIPTPKEYQK